MAKKKKKGKGKSVPMTEEERELYMKQKALAEEEAAKKKQAMLTQFLKVQSPDFDFLIYAFQDHCISVVHNGCKMY